MLLAAAYGVLRHQLVMGLVELVLLGALIMASLVMQRRDKSSPRARRRMLVMTLSLACVTFVSGWFAAKPMADIYGLRQTGEKYITHADCTVGHVLLPARGDKTIYCKGGPTLVESPQAWCFAEGGVYAVDYLPATRLIVQADNKARCGH